MKRLFAVLVLIVTLHLSATAQTSQPTRPAVQPQESQMLSDLKKAKTGSDRLKSLLQLGSYYLYKDGGEKSDLDNADHFLNQAMELGAKLKAAGSENKARFLLAEVLFERQNYPRARHAYLEAIDNYMLSGEKAAAAQAWETIGYRVHFLSDSTPMRGIEGFKHAIYLYEVLHDKEKEAILLKKIADFDLNEGKLDLSEIKLLQALSLFRSVGFKHLHYTYDLLATVSSMKGNYNRALFYALEMIKSAQATGDTVDAYFLYCRIAGVYKDLKQEEKSVYWYKKAAANGVNNPLHLYAANFILFDMMLNAGKKKEAMELLQRLIKKSPPVEIDDQRRAAFRFGNYYNLVGNYALAEKYYLQMSALSQEMQEKYLILRDEKKVADFYFSRKRYAAARIYLNKVLAFPPGIAYVDTIRNTYLMLFRTDSATGDYPSAIKSYQRYKSLTDSIFTVAKARQITELQLQFAKDEKVQQLESRGRLQLIDLQHADTVRNFIIAGALLLLLSLVLGYRRYRQKQLSNRQLESQQQEINLINESLQLTVAEKELVLQEKEVILIEKDKLLSEKNWLLKEVHHRVKNNLHMVISLLESQAAFLEDDALKAVESSLHRIFSMSLIHKKLYQSEEMKTINMNVYFSEFISYLRSSFNAEKYIHIHLEIEPVQLDISQAIPLALVLNEAVTNSIKYAFPDDRQGEINISLHQKDDNIELVIRDNGIGILKKAEDKSGDSLGLKLMKGLIKQIGGQIQFQHLNGTEVVITFEIDHQFEIISFEN